VSTKSICAGWESVYSSNKDGSPTNLPKADKWFSKPASILKFSIIENNHKAMGHDTLQSPTPYEKSN
jgi:hypothetical protein